MPTKVRAGTPCLPCAALHALPGGCCFWCHALPTTSCPCRNISGNSACGCCCCCYCYPGWCPTLLLNHAAAQWQPVMYGIEAAATGRRSPSRKPFLKRRCTLRRCFMRPVPVVLRRMAFTLQLSADATGGQHEQVGGRLDTQAGQDACMNCLVTRASGQEGGCWGGLTMRQLVLITQPLADHQLTPVWFAQARGQTIA